MAVDSVLRTANLYVDMDGVIFDFIGAAIRVHHARGRLLHIRDQSYWKSWSEYKSEMTTEEFWEPLDTAEFWSQLHPYDGAVEAFRRLKQLVPSTRFLTSPSENGVACVTGKLRSIEEHLGLGVHDMIVLRDKYLMASGPDCILVDDGPKNGPNWISRGMVTGT